VNQSSESKLGRHGGTRLWGTVILALAATVGIAACSSSAKSAASSSAATTTPAAASSAAAPASASSSDGTDDASQVGHPTKALCDGKQYTIGYDSFSDTAPGTGTFLSSIKAVIADLGCVTLVHTVNNVDPATALQNARTFVSRKVDAAILFNAITANATGQTQILKAANIPVVQFGAFANGFPVVEAPEFDAGKLAGTQLGQAFATAHPGETPYIIAGRNSASGQPYIGYMDNFVSGAEAAFPGIAGDHVLNLETTSDPVKTQSVVRDALGKVPPSAPVIFMGNDLQVTQAMLQTVLGQSGRTGAIATIDGRGQDADKTAVCSAPQMIGMVNYHFVTFGNFLVPLAILQAQGQTVPATTSTTVDFQSRSELCG
jgi:ribose transport system substrate-binding protein